MLPVVNDALIPEISSPTLRFYPETTPAKSDAPDKDNEAPANRPRAGSKGGKSEE